MSNVSNDAGHFQLLEFMKSNGISQSYLSAALGAHQPNVCRWLKGLVVPPVWAQLDLELVAEIPMQAWHKKGQDEQLERIPALLEFVSELRPSAARRANERIKTLSEASDRQDMPGVAKAGDS